MVFRFKFIGFCYFCKAYHVRFLSLKKFGSNLLRITFTACTESLTYMVSHEINNLDVKLITELT